jgi:NTE family protein
MGSNGHRPQKSRGVLRRFLRGGEKVAFVLSGGASLGSIQVGMLRALFEAGVRPDMLVGTSVGAINAAWIAGWPSSEGVDKLAEIWLGLRRDDVFPIGWTAATALLGRSNHLISNSGLRALLERNLPYERLEQATVPVHVVTSELKSGRAVILSSGPTIDSVLASCAIPGIFPPVSIGKRQLVDGGVANHTSIDAAVRLGAGKIYVLPISYPWLYEEPTNALGMALQALARMVAQRLEAEVAANSFVADIIVIPPLEPMAVSPADFNHTAELLEHGYQSARKMLVARGEAGRRPVLRPLPAGASAA